MSPVRTRTGSRSARPEMIGWRKARIGTTSTEIGPALSSPATGWTRRRRTAMRLAMVSTWGERRSWGRVSHAGSIATPGIHEARAFVSVSASRPVAVRTTRGVAARVATAASRGGRMPTGATIVPERPTSRESVAVSIAGSEVMSGRSPVRSTRCLSR